MIRFGTPILAKWFTLGLSRLHFSQDIWKEEILKKILIDTLKFNSKCNIYIYPRKNKDNMNNALERATKIRKGKTGVGSLQLNSIGICSF